MKAPLGVEVTTRKSLIANTAEYIKHSEERNITSYWSDEI